MQLWYSENNNDFVSISLTQDTRPDEFISLVSNSRTGVALYGPTTCRLLISAHVLKAIVTSMARWPIMYNSLMSLIEDRVSNGGVLSVDLEG